MKHLKESRYYDDLQLTLYYDDDLDESWMSDLTVPATVGDDYPFFSCNYDFYFSVNTIVVTTFTLWTRCLHLYI